MKNQLFYTLFLLILTGSTVFAQGNNSQFNKTKLESAKVAFITNRLSLTPEQAEKFWPIYNKYADERSSVMNELSKIDRAGDNGISDSQAREMIQRRFDHQKKLLDQEREFMGNIVQVISPAQAIKLSNINREFTRQVYRMQRSRENGRREN